MGLPAERIDNTPETATEQVIQFDDGPDLTEDGFKDDLDRQEEAERLNRILDR